VSKTVDDSQRPRLILASASPRRNDLLVSAGIPVEVLPSLVDETLGRGESPSAFVRRLARDKAEAVARLAGDNWRPILAADTVVVVGLDILGKPIDRHEAQQMLERLSGRAHQVITGFCLLAPGVMHQEEVSTTVHFKKLRTEEIQTYLNTREWADKAGAYAIQGQAAFMVQKIDGSYTNVVGLPLCEVVESLRHLGLLWPVPHAESSP
jgi:septum formation protein